MCRSAASEWQLGRGDQRDEILLSIFSGALRRHAVWRGNSRGIPSLLPPGAQAIRQILPFCMPKLPQSTRAHTPAAPQGTAREPPRTSAEDAEAVNFLPFRAPVARPALVCLGLAATEQPREGRSMPAIPGARARALPYRMRRRPLRRSAPISIGCFRAMRARSGLKRWPIWGERVGALARDPLIRLSPPKPLLARFAMGAEFMVGLPSWGLRSRFMGRGCGSLGVSKEQSGRGSNLVECTKSAIYALLTHKGSIR